METKPIVDFSALSGFTGNDKNLMKMHISTFLQFAPSQLQKLRQKLEEKNWMDVGNEAHKLKPKCSYMGIRDAESLFKTIELNAKEQVELEKLPELVSTAESVINQAIEELKAFVNSR